MSVKSIDHCLEYSKCSISPDYCSDYFKEKQKEKKPRNRICDDLEKSKAV